MKHILILSIKLLLIAGILTSQVYADDYSDEKHVSKLKNLIFISPIKKIKEYNALVNDGTFLNIKYNIVMDGEYNSSYMFIKPQNDLGVKKDANFNYNFLNTNIANYLKVLGMDEIIIQKIKLKINESRKEFESKNVIIYINFLQGYDEFNIVFNSTNNNITTILFFRRLL